MSSRSSYPIIIPAPDAVDAHHSPDTPGHTASPIAQQALDIAIHAIAYEGDMTLVRVNSGAIGVEVAWPGGPLGRHPAQITFDSDGRYDEETLNFYQDNEESKPKQWALVPQTAVPSWPSQLPLVADFMTGRRNMVSIGRTYVEGLIPTDDGLEDVEDTNLVCLMAWPN